MPTRQAGWQLLEEREHISALQLPADNDVALRADAMNPKDRLCDVEPDCRNCLHDEFLRILMTSSAADSKSLAHRVRGAVHSIRSSHLQDDGVHC